MKLSDSGLAFLSHEEGLETAPYLDKASRWTIGVGHLLLPGELSSGSLAINGVMVPWRAGLTLQQVQDLFAQDCAPRLAALSKIIVCPLSDNQAAAAFSLYFNAEPPPTASVWGTINGGDWTDLETHWLQWCRDKQHGVEVVDPELLGRRKREWALWGTPDA